MTNEQKLKVNVAAAKMLGLSATIETVPFAGFYIDNVTSVYINVHTFDKDSMFNLFETSADCLAVMKKLGELLVCIDKDSEGWFFWLDGMENGARFETLEEAVGAACLEIKGR